MEITIRQTRVIPTLMHWRKEVIENESGVIPSRALLVLNRRYYLKHTDDGTHIAIVAEADGTDAGCGAICLSEELPSPDNPSGKCARLINIYVRKEFRRQGIGHAIVSWLIEKARQSGCGNIYIESRDTTCLFFKEIGFIESHGYMKYADIQIQTRKSQEQR